MQILVIDDDAETRELVTRALERAGFDARAAANVAEARDELRKASFDALIVDVMLPDGSGLALCESLRVAGLRTPVLFLSARGSVSARVEGLESGGDDYLVKPFAVRELVARVRALGRRGPLLRPRRLDVGAARVDLAARRAERDGSEVPLTAREWDVLEALAARRGRAMTYDDLLEAAWGEASAAARASLEVIVARLRRKLDGPGSPAAIRTLRGVGYALGGEDP